MIGTLKFCNSRDFGFVYSQGIDYFFHRSDFKGNYQVLLDRFKDTKELIQLEFEISDSTQRGPRAKNVKLV